MILKIEQYSPTTRNDFSYIFLGEVLYIYIYIYIYILYVYIDRY